VLHPIAACPFSAKIEYAPLGASTLSPVRVLYPFAACPFSAKIGYAPFGASTLSPVRVLHPFAACPFSAKIGYAPVGAWPISAKNDHAEVGDGLFLILSRILVAVGSTFPLKCLEFALFYIVINPSIGFDFAQSKHILWLGKKIF
jgi:hypothetical protein